MKIISFPHYTCGGLLCDILNGTFSEIGNHGGISCVEHSIGKIGDTANVLENFDTETFMNQVERNLTQRWIGTHCWLGKIDFDKIDKIINVTTETYRSRLYRWTRAYYHYYLKCEPWQGLEGIDQIDKQRETAKNYLIPFRRITHAKVINLEFADVVETQQALFDIIGGDSCHHLSRWQQVNSFLYEKHFWTSEATKRFHEAEHESVLQQAYVYE